MPGEGGERPAARDILSGLPRGALREEIRRAAERARSVHPPSIPGNAGSHEGAPPGGGTITYEERFPLHAGGPPSDLFGPAFRPSWKGPLVFWDLETCGLADEPIFLVGTLRVEGDDLCLRRVLARDPSGEPALLRSAVEVLGPGTVWVTFNGRSFDAPRLRRRAAVHRIPAPEPAEHHDLLLLVRRRWKDRLPDCRLGTVERRLLGLQRGSNDVPGREVPERYRDFVRTGQMRWLEPVLEHNRRDVAAMAVLHARLLAEERATS